MDDPPAGRRPDDAARFEDQGEIARGGMGVVRALWDRLLGRRVALKELPDGSAPDTAAAFVEEAHIMGGLDHPNVLPVYDMQADPGGGPPRLLMKLVDGRTLADLLHESTTPPSGQRLEHLLGVVLKVCDAVSFAHSRGVLHRDLHPRNVMVGSHGQVYVMDWGLAMRRDRAGAPRPPLPRASFGSATPDYMAPEQAWGRDDEIDERTDVFGIGALLYEMLTLRPPFAGKTLAEVLEAARRCQIAPPDVAAPEHEPPARLCEVVMRALAPERGDRHPDVESLRDDLETVLRSGGWFPAQRFARGELLMREGDVGDRAYILSQGACEVFRTLRDRTEILRVVGPGGVVGEIGLVAGTPRVANVRAVTDVTALVVTREALEQELGRASWMRAFVEAAIARFAELDDLRRNPAGEA
jgi:serine/threonine-protein kinase